ncbi:hypothetical protein DEH81_12195 [Pectobacterium zantedeschiae]|nr:hypothetical protein DEH81_12195 [Pectobacterium zantedeschiae]
MFSTVAARARHGAVQSPPPHDPRLFAKSCRYAIPSALVTATRAAINALPARHRLSQRPCRSPCSHSHLSTIITRLKTIH